MTGKGPSNSLVGWAKIKHDLREAVAFAQCFRTMIRMG